MTTHVTVVLKVGAESEGVDDALNRPRDNVWGGNICLSWFLAIRFRVVKTVNLVNKRVKSFTYSGRPDTTFITDFVNLWKLG